MNPAYSQAAQPPPVSYPPHGASLPVSMAPHDAHGRPPAISTYAPVSGLPTLATAPYPEPYSGRPPLEAPPPAETQEVIQPIGPPPPPPKNALEPISKDDENGRKYRLVAIAQRRLVRDAWLRSQATVR